MGQEPMKPEIPPPQKAGETLKRAGICLLSDWNTKGAQLMVFLNPKFMEFLNQGPSKEPIQLP